MTAGVLLASSSAAGLSFESYENSRNDENPGVWRRSLSLLPPGRPQVFSSRSWIFSRILFNCSSSFDLFSASR